MTIYRNILTFSAVEDFYSLFEVVSPDSLAQKLVKVTQYLRDGYKYAANVKDERVRKWDITRHIDLVHTLQICMYQVMKPEEARFLSITMDDQTQINLEPLLDLFDALDDLDQSISDLEELEDVLKNYLNDSNIWDYKEVSETIAHIKITFKSINRQATVE